MKTTFIGKEKNDVTFKMEFGAEEFETALNQAYHQNKGRFTVPGFRKGKAPRKLIEANYGKDIFFEDAINNIFDAAYPAALEELKLEPVDAPNAELAEGEVLEQGKGFIVEVKVTVMPEIKVEGYTGVEVEKVDADVKDEAVEEELKRVQERNARMVLVEDRAARECDTVLSDYAGFVGDEQFEGGTSERYPLELGSHSFIPGFEDQLVGVKAGEEKEVKVTFPTEYHAEHLAGKEAIFKCKVHEIKEKQLDELNDDFAKEVSEFDTLEEYKADIKAGLVKEAEQRARRVMRDKALDAVVEKNEFDIPDAMIKNETGEMMREIEQQLQYQGLSLQQYMQYLNKTQEDMMADMKADATLRVKNRLVMKGVAEAEKLEVSEEDVEAELVKMAEGYKMEVEKLKELLGEESISYLKNDLLNTKAVDFIMDHAVIK